MDDDANMTVDDIPHEEATTQDAASQDTAGQHAADQDPAGQHAADQDTADRDTADQDTAGQARLCDEQVAAYLGRIGHPPVAGPGLEELASLQDAHVRSVPFENLDIHLGIPLSLDVPDLFDKVVRRRRGGFCFELNGLFAALLGALGYAVRLVEARALEEDGGLGPRFDHARIIVDLDDEPWVVDVGTGASPRGPIRLSDEDQVAGHVRHRVRQHEDRYRSEQFDGEAWAPGWIFDLVPRTLDEFAERCHYHQTSPESHFTEKPLCTLVTDDGHLTLSDRVLITTRGGHRTEEEVTDPLRVLRTRFGVEIPRWPGSGGAPDR